jgi:hypothetical protein
MVMSHTAVEHWYAEYWLCYTLVASYLRPSHLSGWSFVKMVTQLDNLTRRAKTMLPDLAASGIECSEVTAGSFAMRLREDRPRSRCFLNGLLRRLAADSGTMISLRQLKDGGGFSVRVEIGKSQ